MPAVLATDATTPVTISGLAALESTVYGQQLQKVIDKRSLYNLHSLKCKGLTHPAFIRIHGTC